MSESPTEQFPKVEGDSQTTVEFKVNKTQPKRGARHARKLTARTKTVTIDSRHKPSSEQDVKIKDLLQTGVDTIDVKERIGQGSHGVVHQGVDRLTDEPVAVKVNKEPEKIGNARVESGHHEAVKSTHILSGRGADIVKYRRGQKYEAHALITEFAADGSLDQVLKNEGRLSMGEASSIGAQVAAALEDLQANELVHSDIKPENIFLVGEQDERLQVAVGDLGIAGPPRTQKEPPRLSIAYAAPEQFAGRYEYASDIYSLGALLYELETGELLFRPDLYNPHGNRADFVRMGMTFDQEKYDSYIRSRLDLIRDTSPETVSLLEDMLRIEPSERPDAHTVRTTLSHISERFSKSADRINTKESVPEQTMKMELVPEERAA